jgi:hypothetical protein
MACSKNSRSSRSTFSFVLCALCVSAVAWSSTATAAGPKRWTHTSEADFQPGAFVNVVATNLGDLKLSRATKTLFEQDPRVSSVYALAQAPDGTVYAGTGPHGVLLSARDGKVDTTATISDSVGVFALAVDKGGKLLLGTGGEQGRIYRLDDIAKPPVEVFASPDVQYIWAMTVTPDGTLYAATGPNGQLIAIPPDGRSKVLFDSTESNLLSLVSDGKGALYVGSDPGGIVYRIDTTTGQARVLYDANETEISALALDATGSLYAATAQEVEAAGEEEAASESIGRPEEPTTGAPVPATPPGDAPPNPNPGRPEPAPRQDLPGGDVEGDGDATVLHNARAPASAPSPDAAGGSNTESTEAGNAIYRIDPAGFVTEIFRGPTMILSLLEENGTLLAGTGGEGYVYQVRPAAGENVAIARLESSDQVMAMLPAADGQILLGLANSGGVATMSRGFATTGTYTSDVLDAGQVSAFGTLRVHAQVPDKATVTVATRSGNLKDAHSAGAWSPWSAERPLAGFIPTDAPAGRFFQYRLTLKSDDATTTPAVTDVTVPYQVPNLPPVVKSIKVAPAKDDKIDATKKESALEPNRRQTVTWEATDPNEDALHYTLAYRTAGDGPWIELKKDLADAEFTWDTKTVADGRYELRVTASDERANPVDTGRTASRISDPVTVDNTAPQFTDTDTEVDGERVKLSLKLSDPAGTVSQVEFAVDSGEDWQAVAASDRIYDSPDEAATFVTASLKPGPHQIAVRATDENGNQAMKNLVISIPPANH